MKAEIARFFDMFVKAFSAFKGGDVANLYHVPGIALRGDGSIQTFQSGADIEGFFQTALDRYDTEGRAPADSGTWMSCR
jgi:hypothetical protein